MTDYYPQYCNSCNTTFITENRNCDCPYCESVDTINCYRELNKERSKYDKLVKELRKHCLVDKYCYETIIKEIEK